MREMHLRIFAVVITTTLLPVPVYTQQSHWASADDKTAKYIIEMERKWAEGVCIDNGVVAGLLADDFQGTSTKGARYTKADELKDEKGAHIAHDCELDEAKVRFFGDSISVVLRQRTLCRQRQVRAERKGLPGLDRHVAEARGYVADHRLAR